MSFLEINTNLEFNVLADVGVLPLGELDVQWVLISCQEVFLYRPLKIHGRE
jgi:hypothetical protein